MVMALEECADRNQRLNSAQSWISAASFLGLSDLVYSISRFKSLEGTDWTDGTSDMLVAAVKAAVRAPDAEVLRLLQRAADAKSTFDSIKLEEENMRCCATSNYQLSHLSAPSTVYVGYSWPLMSVSRGRIPSAGNEMRWRWQGNEETRSQGPFAKDTRWVREVGPEWAEFLARMEPGGDGRPEDRDAWLRLPAPMRMAPVHREETIVPGSAYAGQQLTVAQQFPTDAPVNLQPQTMLSASRQETEEQLRAEGGSSSTKPAMDPWDA
eukprot:SAG11_NODE_1969_length_3985_cov_2.930777_6_plen_267_part_00